MLLNSILHGVVIFLIGFAVVGALGIALADLARRP